MTLKLKTPRIRVFFSPEEKSMAFRLSFFPVSFRDFPGGETESHQIHKAIPLKELHQVPLVPEKF